MSRRDVILGGAVLLLFGTAVLRLALPDRTRLRALSVEGLWDQGETVAPGATVTKELTWKPPEDVYVLGWNPWVGIPAGMAASAQLLLYDADRKTSLFLRHTQGSESFTGDDAQETPNGTGYHVRKGVELRFRYKITSQAEAPFVTFGAGTLIYFVPVEGN
jgi:hypothetical protein